MDKDISQDEFAAALTDLVSMLSKSNVLETVEKICELYIVDNMSARAYSQLISALSFILGDKAGVFLAVLQMGQNFVVPETKGERQTVARLNKMKNIYGLIIGNTQASFVRPLAYKGAIGSGEPGNNHFYVNFTRGDGQSFACEFNYNEAMQVLLHFSAIMNDSVVLDEKNIDLKLTKHLLENIDKVYQRLKTLTEKREKESE